MMNPIQFIQAIRNPQAFLGQIMSDPQMQNNPIAQNAMTMMQNGNSKGLEQIARNLAQQKGIDIDALRKQLGV